MKRNGMLAVPGEEKNGIMRAKGPSKKSPRLQSRCTIKKGIKSAKALKATRDGKKKKKGAVGRFPTICPPTLRQKRRGGNAKAEMGEKKKRGP